MTLLCYLLSIGFKDILDFLTFVIGAITLIYVGTQYKETKKQFKKQSKDTHFFNMLTYFNMLTDRISVTKENEDFFKKAVEQMKSVYKAQADHEMKYLLDLIKSRHGVQFPDINAEVFFGPQDDTTEDVFLHNMIEAWKIRYKERYGEIEMERVYSGWIFLYLYTEVYDTRTNQYFRYLHNLIDFVYDNFKSSKRDKYMQLVSIHLSSQQMALLFYNCISDVGLSKKTEEPIFYNRVKESGLVESVDVSLLMNSKHLAFY